MIIISWVLCDITMGYLPGNIPRFSTNGKSVFGTQPANKNYNENGIAELLKTKLRDLCMSDWLPK